MSSIRPAIIVHGGAGTYAAIIHDNASKTAIEEGVREAAKAGYAILSARGSTVDAVEAATIVMENNPIFNAGRGSCMTIDGTIEMDASIMDGSTLEAGGVACIRNVANPIHVARLVMDKSQHVLFSGDGGLAFAKKHGVEEVPDEYLATEKARRRLANFPQFIPSTNAEFYEKRSNQPIADNGTGPGTDCGRDGEDHDTVGAVAIDSHGNVAYANSTGGMSAKMVGRIGDSPLVGCGGYADNLAGAVATTGHGEAFIRTCLSKHIAILMQQGECAQDAAKCGIDLMEARVKGDGGCIAVDRCGGLGIYFNVEGMAWAYCRDNQLHYGIYKDEHVIGQL